MPQLIRDRSPRSTGHGTRPEDRDVDQLLDAGVIILDKVQGPTSHQVTAWVRSILQVNRIGHGGTLDPQVSGVLPIALGRATKLTDLVLRSDKEYVCHMRLHRERKEERIREVISTFIGEVYQTPPVRSAVKRQMRVRRIHDIKVLEIEGRNVLFRVRCDAGTYIRTLCVDIGDALGVGANMEALRRTRSGSMAEKESCTLQQLTDAVARWKEDGDASELRSIIRPMEMLLEPLPKVVLKDSSVGAVSHGSDLATVGIASLDESINKGATVAMFTRKGEAVGLGVALMGAAEMHKADQGWAIRTDRVLMAPTTYPKMWTVRQRPD